MALTELVLSSKRWRPSRLAAVLSVILAITAGCDSGIAKSPMREFVDYQTICTVVEVQSDRRLEGQFDRDLLNRSTASVAASLLHQRQIDAPVDFGRQCYPGNVGTAPRQLSLQFRVTVACGAAGCGSETLAIVLYTFYPGIERAPGSYSTAISYCSDGVDLSNCLLQNLTTYLNDNVMPMFELVQQLKQNGIK